jgi:hypothetical protein
MKSRKVRWIGHVADMEEMRNTDIGTDGILDVRAWCGYDWLRMGYSDWLCDHNNEPLGSIKGDEFLD